jgi:N-acetyl-beta-hexosaminidase
MDAARLLIPVKRYVNLAGKFYWPAPKGPAGSTTSLPATVRIRCNSRLESREACQIMILPDKIEITAAGDAGAHYAIQTLMDLIALENGSLRCCKIEDWPDFARRGIYLDCSRGKVPKLDTLKELVSQMAHWKIKNFSFTLKMSLHSADILPSAEAIVLLQAMRF